MRTGIACIVLALALVGGPASSASPQAPDPNSAEAKKARLAWFHEAKYGLFIHWGIYAIPAGEWKGARVPGIGEWIMFRARIPVPEYEQLAKQWNPVKFDAEAWVQLARDAGMKYIVITSKHHDGFALFDSKVSRWDAVDATPVEARHPEGARRRLREARHAAGLLLLAGPGLARAERRGQHLGLRPRRRRRTSTSTCARRPSRRCASCSPATVRSRSSGSTRRA